MTLELFKMDDDFINIPPPPQNKGFTIYTKSNCPRCSEVKELLYNDENKIFVDCDGYLNNKESFKNIMFNYMNVNERKILYFPVVFYNGEYIKNIYRFFDN